ncbi:protocadherin gamma-A11 isoform X8 [Oryzias melastigma]|uniref:protocadherin gamma-A11 isoform X8 n=1 Tax=Oryzias melastigma TaxID=30732 RepID=UPI00168CC523|nr:protocadherin gamma-A11 isoform X8 [Oryzias melastigma]
MLPLNTSPLFFFSIFPDKDVCPALSNQLGIVFLTDIQHTSEFYSLCILIDRVMIWVCGYFHGKTMFSSWTLRLLLSFLFAQMAVSQVRYSIPEEMATGSFVGNVIQDLGLDLKRLRSGRARIFTEDGSEYIGLNVEKGTLVVVKRIDREELCQQVSPCSLHFQIILENPMELHRIDVEVTDINDNVPNFSEREYNFQVIESALPGARYSLESARDPDVAQNAVQTYKLNPSDHFKLNTVSRSDGTKYIEMVLHTPLDREKQEEHKLTLIALDGGSPQKSGSVKINVEVLDANDNAPVFSQSVYRAVVPENAPKGTAILKVSATDNDKGANGEMTFSFPHQTDGAASVFNINPQTGEIIVSGGLDYEKTKQYEINIEVSDKGGLTDTSKVQIEITDVNDNAPVINIISLSNPIPEDSALNTVIAMINIKDLDSGKNGQVRCFISPHLPFKIKTSSTNFYSLISDDVLDRETVPDYNITITAMDEGSPPYSTNKTIRLIISDVNDNAPVFPQNSLSAFIPENNSPGTSVLSVKAQDADHGNNARVSYFLEEVDINGMQASTYFSVNAESGEVLAVRSFDYEQTKEFHICVKAQDGGSPPLSSNVSVKIQIQDQNDNPPQVLYPVQTAGSVVAEMVPRSADVGYLVTKVVAVDVDSGQNAWLSYKLQKATDRALFEVGSQNGEIRTVRQVTEKDLLKQRLTVIVEDNGQPSRSATVIVNVAVADSFPEVLSEFSDFPHDKDYNDNLTFYLVLALAVVSFLFITCLVVIISVKIYRWRQERLFSKCTGNLPVIPYYPPLYADAGGTGTLKQALSYDVYGTTDSRMSDVKNSRPFSQNSLTADHSGTRTMPKQRTDSEIFLSEQKPPNNDWRFTQGQRPGPSGATGGPEVAMGTGPWPQPPTEAEQLQALMAAANEVSEATATLGPGTMGLSTRYSPQFTLQHVPDYRQNVYIPGSTATLTSNPQQQQQATAQQATQQALPPPQASAQSEPPKAVQTPASKKKSTKKEKK